MANRPMPDAELLRKLFHYDPETGNLFWKERPVDLFLHCKNPAAKCAIWNTKFSGKRALAADSGAGYRTGKIFNVDAFAHRVAWKWMTGEEPNQIDHINGVRDDNRFENLRNVGYAENSKNHAMKRSNTSGITGVSYDKAQSKWIAYIRTGGKMKHLGTFPDIRSATAARVSAERELGYHENHGKRAPAY